MIINHHGLISQESGEQPVPPTPPQPTYEYRLLVNFIDEDIVPGEVIGTGFMIRSLTDLRTYMNDEEYDWFAFYDWGWGDNYTYDSSIDYSQYKLDQSKQNLLVDTDNPIDFLSKNVSTGTPCSQIFGLVEYEDDLVRYMNAIPDNGIFTLEFWASIGQGSFDHETSFGRIALVDGVDYENYVYFNINCDKVGSNEDEEEYRRFLELWITGNFGGTSYDELAAKLVTKKCDTEEESIEEKNNVKGWHHYAITSDGTNLRLFYDGTLIGTFTSSEVCHAIGGFAFEIEHDYNYYAPMGRFAQIAICEDCKWTSDFDVPTQAY